VNEPPDPATLAAIVAAVEATWPRTGATAPAPVPVEPSRWRFSARPWPEALTRRPR